MVPSDVSVFVVEHTIGADGKFYNLNYCEKLTVSFSYYYFFKNISLTGA
jgi:hypothetical protein